MHPVLKHYAKRLLGRPTVPPPVDGVAGADWYDAAYRAIDHYTLQYWQSHYYFLWSVLADRIRAGGVRSVLDIGCGPGQFADCLFSLTPIQDYTGLDFSAEAVGMAKRVCTRGRFIVGDATTTTIHQETPHDLVVCTEVLEHVPGDRNVISRFKTGVRCLCTVPNFDYDSHVRYFNSTEEVADRYGRFFDQLDVWALRANKNHIYYLMDGVRNTYSHSSSGS
jgi:SAM-dependent methyltransferase